MAIPILKSSDLERTIAFCTGTLGAEILWRGPGYAALLWGAHELHISAHAGDGAFGSAVYFPVDDVDATFAALLGRGLKPPLHRGPVYASPTDQTWGMRELYVSDPDGNCLRFGSPCRQ
jgi:catechol 2,3-dioxygenase-like lactoylglutathione lyase family enzyme